MNNKFWYLYLAGGTVASLLFLYQLLVKGPPVSYARLFMDGVIALLFYYLAFKIYREKKDQDIM